MKLSNILELGRGSSESVFSKFVKIEFKSSGAEFLRISETNNLVELGLFVGLLIGLDAIFLRRSMHF